MILIPFCLIFGLAIVKARESVTGVNVAVKDLGYLFRIEECDPDELINEILTNVKSTESSDTDTISLLNSIKDCLSNPKFKKDLHILNSVGMLGSLKNVLASSFLHEYQNDVVKNVVAKLVVDYDENINIENVILDIKSKNLPENNDELIEIFKKMSNYKIPEFFDSLKLRDVSDKFQYFRYWVFERFEINKSKINIDYFSRIYKNSLLNEYLSQILTIGLGIDLDNDYSEVKKFNEHQIFLITKCLNIYFNGNYNLYEEYLSLFNTDERCACLGFLYFLNPVINDCHIETNEDSLCNEIINNLNQSDIIMYNASKVFKNVKKPFSNLNNFSRCPNSFFLTRLMKITANFPIDEEKNFKFLTLDDTKLYLSMVYLSPGENDNIQASDIKNTVAALNKLGSFVEMLFDDERKQSCIKIAKYLKKFEIIVLAFAHGFTFLEGNSFLNQVYNAFSILCINDDHKIFSNTEDKNIEGYFLIKKIFYGKITDEIKISAKDLAMHLFYSSKRLISDTNNEY